MGEGLKRAFAAAKATRKKGKSMTGDGAVVRKPFKLDEAEIAKAREAAAQLRCGYRPGEMSTTHLQYLGHLERQQAAEIERLTRELEGANNDAARYSAKAIENGVNAHTSEARTADLLKALEDAEAILGALNAWISLGMHKAMATGGPAQELMLKDIQVCLTTIQAAAKGETV